MKGKKDFGDVMNACFARALGDDACIIDAIIEKFFGELDRLTARDRDLACNVAAADVIGFKLIETACMGAHTGWDLDCIYCGKESNIVEPDFESLKCPARMAEFLTPAKRKYLKKKGYKVGTINDSQSDLNGCMIIYCEN